MSRADRCKQPLFLEKLIGGRALGALLRDIGFDPADLVMQQLHPGGKFLDRQQTEVLPDLVRDLFFGLSSSSIAAMVCLSNASFRGVSKASEPGIQKHNHSFHLDSGSGPHGPSRNDDEWVKSSRAPPGCHTAKARLNSARPPKRRGNLCPLSPAA